MRHKESQENVFYQSQRIPGSRIRDSSVAKDQLLRNDTGEEVVIPKERSEEESLKGIWWKTFSSGK